MLTKKRSLKTIIGKFCLILLLFIPIYVGFIDNTNWTTEISCKKINHSCTIIHKNLFGKTSVQKINTSKDSICHRTFTYGSSCSDFSCNNTDYTYALSCSNITELKTQKSQTSQTYYRGNTKNNEDIPLYKTITYITFLSGDSTLRDYTIIPEVADKMNQYFRNDEIETFNWVYKLSNSSFINFICRICIGFILILFIFIVFITRFMEELNIK